MEKREPSCTDGGTVNCCSHYGKQYGGFSKKLKIELPYDPAFPLLGIYPKKSINTNLKNICIAMFIAALFTKKRSRSNPRVH